MGLALNLNNVDNVQDPVFALLGNAAAAAGAGLVEDLDCLQQRIADQAFTNAKEISDVEGMTNALIFRTLERNTAAVGQASVLCTEVAQNPEIAVLQQHQDPASEGAAALNKDIVLELAVQLAAIGADPQLALLSGTFEPGDVSPAIYSIAVFCLTVLMCYRSTILLARETPATTLTIPLAALRR